MLTGFSGGGGIEAGAIGAGLNPILAIENDPTKPELSGKLRQLHSYNFPSSKILPLTVQDWAKTGFIGAENCDAAHFSPVCTNFSIAKVGGRENRSDIEAAKAIAQYIKTYKPSLFTLEQVQAYSKSYSFKLIWEALDNAGYKILEKVINCADYGVPQSRKRLFVIAKLSGSPVFPNTCDRVGWFASTKDLILDLPKETLTKTQEKAIAGWENNTMLLPRFHNKNLRNRIVPYFKPVYTLTRSLFDDGKGYGRSKTFTVMYDRKAYNASTRFLARLQSFPDSYKFSGDIRIDGSAIGYSVPPLMMQKIYEAN